MKPFRHSALIALAVFLAIGWSGCGPDREMIKKEAQDSRKIGEAYLRAGNPTAALSEFLKAEKKDPDNYILQNDLGQAYYDKGHPELAIPHYQKAIELKPDYAPGKNNLGYAYLKNKQYDEAIATFTSVSQDLLYATPHFPLAGLGMAYYYKGQYDLAEKNYLKALDINPRYPTALWGLGLTQMAEGNPGEALKNLEKAVELAPNFTEAWFDLGQARKHAGDRAGAIEAFRKVRELAPDAPLAASAADEIASLEK
jgi:type IV pilus assembly protein PilF